MVMLVSELFTFKNVIMIAPVAGAGLILMPLLYTGLVDAIMPWKELRADDFPEPIWTDAERGKTIARRNEARMAYAREAWRRGDPNAAAMIGRRSSDYEALGIPFPE